MHDTDSLSQSRRNFLKAAAVAGAAAAAASMAGCAPSARKAVAATVTGSVPATWDMEADVVVVGGGGAGFMAAMAAQEKGAKVLVLEKNDRFGGDSSLCAGIFIGFNPEATEQASGERDNFESWLADQLKSNPFSQKGRRGEGVGDTSLVELQAQLTAETFAWTRDVCGVEWLPFDYCHNCWTPQPSWDGVYPRDWIVGSNFFKELLEHAKTLDGIEMMTDTRVYEIVLDGAGRAVGVRAIGTDGVPFCAKASRGVVLASGSFSANQGMVAKHLGADVGRMCNPGMPTNTGDGMQMVEQIGGKLKDMDLGSAWFTGTRGSNSLLLVYAMSNYGDRAGIYMPGILVNREGRRYASENMGYNLGGLGISEQTYNEAFYVTDRPGAVIDDNGSLFRAGTDVGDDAIIEAGTLEELAVRMNVPEKDFLEQVDRWNGFIDKGEDEEFGRAIAGCRRIEKAPFYAIPLHGMPYTTYGGIAVDADTRVLDRGDQPIPGLFAAGICTGSFAEQAGLFYLGGVSQTLIFGRRAGQVAAAEQPWS